MTGSVVRSAVALFVCASAVFAEADTGVVKTRLGNLRRDSLVVTDVVSSGVDTDSVVRIVRDYDATNITPRTVALVRDYDATNITPRIEGLEASILSTIIDLQALGVRVSWNSNKVIAVAKDLYELKDYVGVLDRYYTDFCETNRLAARLANFRAKRIEYWQDSVTNHLLLANAVPGSTTNGLKQSAYFSTSNDQLVATISACAHIAESDPTIGLTNGTIYIHGSTITPLAASALNGYATQAWVTNLNYVTEAVTNGLATTNYVNEKIGDVKSDRITATNGLSTIHADGMWVTRTNATAGVAETNALCTVAAAKAYADDNFLPVATPDPDWYVVGLNGKSVCFYESIQVNGGRLLIGPHGMKIDSTDGYTKTFSFYVPEGYANSTLEVDGSAVLTKNLADTYYFTKVQVYTKEEADSLYRNKGDLNVYNIDAGIQLKPEFLPVTVIGSEISLLSVVEYHDEYAPQVFYRLMSGGEMPIADFDVNGAFVVSGAPELKFDGKDPVVGQVMLQNVGYTPTGDSIATLSQATSIADVVIAPVSNAVFNAQTYFDVDGGVLSLVKDTNVVWRSTYSMTNLVGETNITLHSGSVVRSTVTNAENGVALHLLFPDGSESSGDAVLRIEATTNAVIDILSYNVDRPYVLKGDADWNTVDTGDTLLMFTKTAVTNGVTEIWCSKSKSSL